MLHSGRSGAFINYLRNGTTWLPAINRAATGADHDQDLSLSDCRGVNLCALQTTTGPPASALDRWIELTNNTRMAIVEIYISHVGAEFWNADLLGADFLAPASSILVNIDDRAGCLFDVKTVFDDEQPWSGEMSTYARLRDMRSPIDSGVSKGFDSKLYLRAASNRTA